MTSPSYVPPHSPGWWAKKKTNLAFKVDAAFTTTASAKLYGMAEVASPTFGLDANVELRGGDQKVLLDSYANGIANNGFWVSKVSGSWQHTVADLADMYLLVFFHDYYSNEYWYQQDIVCQCDGINMTPLKFQQINNNRALRVFGLKNPPPGTKTCYVKQSSGTLGGREVATNSVSYSGVHRIGDVTSKHASGSSPVSNSVYTLINQVVAQSFGTYYDLSAYSKHLLGHKTVDGWGNTQCWVGDIAGTGNSESVSAHLQYSSDYASIEVPLWP